MISGHVGVAFAIRNARRDVPLWAYLTACVLPDLFDLGYAAARFCSPYGLYSHSLPAISILAAATFAVALAVTRRPGPAVALGATVLLHLPADLVTGEKMLWAGGPIVGLLVYTMPLLDFVIEVPIVTAGWVLLRRNPQAVWWAAGIPALGLLITLQAGFDIAKAAGTKAKPNACVAGEMVPRAVRLPAPPR